MTYKERKINEKGPGYVPCEVSGRWLQFPEKSGGNFQIGELMEVKVMTKGDSGNERLLCSLIITKEDLVRAINSVKTPE